MEILEVDLLSLALFCFSIYGLGYGLFRFFRRQRNDSERWHTIILLFSSCFCLIVLFPKFLYTLKFYYRLYKYEKWAREPVDNFAIIWVTKNEFLIIPALVLIVVGLFYLKQKRDKSKSFTLLDKKGIQKKKNQLELILATEKVFRNERLNVETLAKHLKWTPKELSFVINKGYGKNFNDFINEFRIEDFKTRIQKGENESFTIISIAYDAGFNSKSSFYRAFKKATNQTPKEFLRTVT